MIFKICPTRRCPARQTLQYITDYNISEDKLPNVNFGTRNFQISIDSPFTSILNLRPNLENYM